MNVNLTIDSYFLSTM